MKITPLALSILLLATSIIHAAKQPNIVIILADDMGYSDPGYMGGEAQTPALDQLAKDGVTFLNGFNNAKCAPTRAALMTGLSCQRINAFKSKGYITKENNAASIADILGANGYETIIAGKWHIAPEPMKAGFQHQFGVNLMPYYFKPNLKRDGKLQPIALDGEPIDLGSLPEDWYSTVAYTDYAIQSIQQYAIDKEKPFFLYLSYNTPHSPLAAPKEVVDKYADLYEAGSDVAREQRMQRLKAKGIVAPNHELPPVGVNKDDGRAYAWENFNEKEQRLFKRKLALNAAMIDVMDTQIAKLVQKLKDTNQYDNTLIFFLSDNGATTEKGIYGGLNFDKLTNQDIDKLGTREGMLGGTSGEVVATVQNAPFTGGKTRLWDGGMRSSMIIHYPGNMSDHAVQNYNRETVTVFDIAPTCYAAAGIDYASNFPERALQPMDGVNLLPLLKGGQLAERNVNFMYKGDRVIRNEKWKLFGTYNTSKMKPGHWALYDLENDPGEQNDLSSEFPEIAETLSAEWDAWNDSTGSIQGYHDFFEHMKSKSKKK